jgi:oxygen tolerance protein BatD
MQPYLSSLRVASIALFAFLACFGLRPALPSFAQQPAPAPVSAEAQLDKTHATIGDPVSLSINIRYESGAQVSTDTIPDQFAPFEVLNADPPNDQRGANGSGELKLRFRVAAYHTGPIELPALTIPYKSGDKNGTIQTQPVQFAVDSVIPPGDKATDIRPLKAQLDLPVPAAPSLLRILIFALAALAILIVAGAVWYWTRPAPAPPIIAQPFEASLESEAREELDRIMAENYLARADYRTHYALIAACIRRYITRRYGFQASALTTAELGERMVRSGVGRWRARLVADLLAECDAVHYAHYLPAPARAQADVQRAYEIVDLALSQETWAETTRVGTGG